ncbi:MAG: glycosyltransferase family 4 protein [Desulfurella sp.]|uniref:glycosyltransferase family 4 protein n=1 Tax=Desulfurella sp. TaxID=1962857 RepID=UPI003D0D9C71
MKIAIVTPSPVPFVVGGAEKLFMGLLWYFNKLTPHSVELIKLPCKDQEFWSLMDCYKRFSELKLDYFDMVITTKYPAWMINHKNHHLYLQHTCRGVYDLYHKQANIFEPLPNSKELKNLYAIMSDPKADFNCLSSFFSELFGLYELKHLRELFVFPGPLTRAIIHFLDKIALSPKNIKSYSAISYNVAQRENYFPENVDIQIIHHPSALDNLHSKEYNYIFTASRLEDLKRIDLLINAYKKVKSPMKFKIAGTGSAFDKLKNLAKDDERIEFLGFISDDQMIEHYSRAYFVPYVPYDEDYGLITLEAMQSQKSVITTTDAGGTNELVQNGLNGFIVPPTPQDIAQAMQTLIENPELTLKLGKNAKSSTDYINWQNTISKLLKESLPSKMISIPKKPKMLVLSTFSIYPAVQGGQKRIYNIYKQLSKRFDVVLISLTSNPSQAGVKHISANFKEIAILKSKKHLEHEKDIALMLNFNAIEDIAAIEGYKYTLEFLEAIRKQALDADVAVLEHPYLYYALNEFFRGNVFYDAQNAEYIMKDIVLPQSAHKQEYLTKVYDIEKNCATNSKYVFYVSDHDLDFFVNKYNLNKNKLLSVPNGEDFKYAASKTLNPSDRSKLKAQLGLDKKCVVFSGSYHSPNIDALRYIEQFAFQLNDIVFFIIGSVCNALKKDLENIVPLGIVSENEKALVYNISDLALNPILKGAGSNIKLIDYVAFSVACLTTPTGKRGYDIDGLFTQDIDNFSNKIKELLSSDKDNLEESAKKAFESASKKFDWSIIVSKLFNVIC